jgi:choline monooxygenase
MKLADFVTPDQVAALHRPTAEAEGLPAPVYTEEFYRLENELLFPKTWCAVAVNGDLPNPGDVWPVMLGEWPIVLVRARAGQVNAFLNVCRHRRMRVVLEPAKGKKTLACPWHCWTYGLDGTLIATPNVGGMHVHESPELSKKDLGLRPVRVALFHDLILVNLDGEAPSFEEHRKPVDELWRDWDLDGLHYAGRHECRYEGNWKVAIEGGVEEYHLPWGHPQTMVGVADVFEQQLMYDTVFCATHYVPKFRSDGTHVEQFAPVNLPTIRPRHSDGHTDPNTLYVVNLFPTALMALNADLLLYALFTPDGPAHSKIVFNYYFHPEAAKPEHAPMRQATLDAWEQIMPQDDDYVRYVHRNMAPAEAAGIRARFSGYWEGAVHHFQKMVVETIRRAEAARGIRDVGAGTAAPPGARDRVRLNVASLDRPTASHAEE